MWRFFFFLLGFGFMVIGFTYIVTYLNLLTMGYSFYDYISYIFSRIECFFSIFGFIIITLVILTSGRGKYDIYLWYFIKF